MKRRARTRGGFKLLELLVAIGIIALMLCFTLVGIQAVWSAVRRLAEG